jgi:hypothetical protein
MREVKVVTKHSDMETRPPTRNASFPLGNRFATTAQLFEHHPPLDLSQVSGSPFMSGAVQRQKEWDKKFEDAYRRYIGP